MVLTSIPEGTVVDVLDGPLTAEDGSLWYSVIALDQQGVLPATLLIPGEGTIEESPDLDEADGSDGEAVTEDQAAPPIPTGEVATIAGTNDEGARCRTEPTYEAEVIDVLHEGQPVALTGPASEEWQPLVCGSVQGYVHNDFVLLEGESPLEPAPVEEVPVEEVPVEEVPVAEAPAEEVPVAEEPIAEEPVAEEPVVGEPVDEEVPADEAPVVEEPVDEVPATDVPAEDVPVEGAPVEEEPVFEAPAEENPATEPEPTDEGETPTEELTEAPVDVVDETPVATEEPAETETPVATEEPTEVPVETPTVVEPSPVPTVAVPEIEAEEAEAIQQTFTAAVDSGSSDATGYAVVAGTNGDGVRCRASGSTNAPIITVLAEGTEVALRGSASGEWQPVVCAKSNGFVHTDYLAKSDGSGDITAAVGSDGEFTAAAVTGTAVVSGTGGGGLRCRTSASYSGGVITVLGEGTKVNLNGSAQGEWQPVICGGKNGFAHVDYLTKSASSSKSNTDAASNTGTGSSGSAKVTGTNGDGVRCRSMAGYDGMIITVLAEGATVTLRGATQGEWTPVTCAGKSGFVHKDYLTKSSGSTGGGGTSGGSTSGGSASGTAKVTGTGGGGLNCRSSASSSGGVLMVLSEGATVTLRGAAQGMWQPIVCGGKNGFASVDYLTKSSGGSTSGGGTSGGSNGGGTSGGGSTGGFAIGSRVVTTSSLNLRYEPSMSAGVAAVAPSGTVVKVTGNRQGFVAVSWDGLKGWMHSDYVVATNAALSVRGGSGTPATPAPTPSTPAPSGSKSGGAIVDFAMQYVGYPYVWAGEGPYGFDCSGFTMYVIKNVLGINITHDMFVQYDMGAPVSRNALQPGDIVFFQNTFRWGMSHTGIYIGGGQFVHAENETTGVRVSDINSQYYSSRYYGAVRFT